jgi:transposase
MAYAKYTREMLSEAVAASTSMAGVLRHLGRRQNGGSHAHLRRRIDQLGIDTSHFLGQAHARGMVSTRRRAAEEILIMRPEDAKRAKPPTLTRALREIGRSYACESCGLGDTWNGRPITLHVDHIDGRFWDCRPENLRFLCPNCHSQTATYAGRNRPKCSNAGIRVDEHGDAVAVDPTTQPAGQQPLSEQDKVEVLARVGRKELTVSGAARLIGCNRDYVYELQRRLAERGTLAPAQRGPRTPAEVRAAVVAFALQHPMLGVRQVARELRRRQPVPIMVEHGTVTRILRREGLNSQAARVAALSDLLVRQGHRLDSSHERR